MNLTPTYMESMKQAMDTFNTIDWNKVSYSMDKASQINLHAIERANSVNINAALKSIDAINSVNLEKISQQISFLLRNVDFDTIFKQYEITINWANLYQLKHNTLIQVLNDYQWFVTPEMPIDFLLELVNISETNGPRERRKKINKHFFNYFADNDYENLKGLVEKWESSKKFKPGRLKIIKDCLNVIIISKNGKIPSTLIVPTLIAQIEGMQTEFLLKNDFKISKRQFIHPDTGKKRWPHEAWKDTYVPEDVFSLITNEIILDVLFASVYPGEPIKTPINFSRHKIMHGEHVNYGTVPNTLRTFIIIDFLHNLL